MWCSIDDSNGKFWIREPYAIDPVFPIYLAKVSNLEISQHVLILWQIQFRMVFSNVHISAIYVDA